MKRFKRYVAYAIGLIVGSYVASRMGGTAFFSASQVDIRPFAPPLAVAAIASCVLGYFCPAHRKSISLSVAMPMLLTATVMTIGLLVEGRWSLGWIYLASMVAVACYVGVWISSKLPR